MHVKIDLGLLFFAYISACGWCRERASSSSTNQMKYKNKSRLDPPRSSVLLVVCLYNLCSHRLLIMLKFVMILLGLSGFGGQWVHKLFNSRKRKLNI